MGNIENDIIQLVTLAVIEQDVFAGGLGVAEAVAYVEAEGLAVDNAVA